MGRAGSVIPTASLARTEVRVEKIRSEAADSDHYPPSIHAALISSPEPDPTGLRFGFVKYTRALGRKMIGLSNNGETSPTDLYASTPLKKQRSGKLIWESETSVLEALPQEILIKIVCGVHHEDLKQLCMHHVGWV